MIKLSVNETKWSSLLARTRALILYISIWIFDFGPVKLPGLLRNGPQGRQFLKSPGNFLVPKSNSQTKRRSRCLPVYEICKVSSQQNSVTSPQYAVTFARKGSLEQSTIGSTKWTRRHGARALIPVGKRFLIELYSRPRGGDEMSEQIFWTDKKICPFSEQLLISQIMICASL